MPPKTHWLTCSHVLKKAGIECCDGTLVVVVVGGGGGGGGDSGCCGWEEYCQGSTPSMSIPRGTRKVTTGK